VFFNLSLRIEPTEKQYIHYFITMGKYATFKNQLEEAVSYYSKAIEIQPHCKKALKKRTLLYER
jgi:tetratricopeptide (TPR) repeat protein